MAYSGVVWSVVTEEQVGQANSHQAARRQAVSRSDTGPYGRPLELLPFAEIRQGWDTDVAGG